jgi:hypothetical protein
MTPEMRCVFCGETADELHHITARYRGLYLDPQFVVPLCAGCHHGETRAWRHAGLDAEDGLPTVLRLRRLCWLATRLGDLDQAPTLDLGFWRAAGDCLRAVLGALEGWS